MGHIRLGMLPDTKRWRDVVALVRSNATIERIASASVEAAGTAFRQIGKDSGAVESAWLLLNLPHTARAEDPDEALAELGMGGTPFDGPISLAASFCAAIDARLHASRDRTDLGEMAQMAGVESLVAVLSDNAGTLFDTDPRRLRHELARLGSLARFGSLARAFVGRLAYKVLDYFLSRALPNEVGEGRRFLTLKRLADFSDALETHCFGCAIVVSEFSGKWASARRWEEGAIDREAAATYIAGAMGKTVKALRLRAGLHVD